MVTEEHLAEGRLYPPLKTIREVSFKIAVKVSSSFRIVNSPYFQPKTYPNFLFQIVDHAYKQGTASWYPEPKDKEAFVLSKVYNSDYDSFNLDSYSWPKEAMDVQDV